MTPKTKVAPPCAPRFFSKRPKSVLVLIAFLVQMWASVVMPFEHLWMDFVKKISFLKGKVSRKVVFLVENIGNDPLYIKDLPLILTLYIFRGLIQLNGDDDKSLCIYI